MKQMALSWHGARSAGKNGIKMTSRRKVQASTIFEAAYITGFSRPRAIYCHLQDNFSSHGEDTCLREIDNDNKDVRSPLFSALYAAMAAYFPLRLKF